MNVINSRGRLLWLLVLAMLLTSCSKTKPPESLVFADPDNPIAALIYVAEAKGFFKDENLSIAYKKVSSGRDSIESVLKGESDIAIASEFPFANALLQGKPVRILCAVQRTNYSSAVVARRDRGINAAADLRGKRVGLAVNTNSDYLLSTLVRAAGISDEAITRIALAPQQLADALEKGEVDAVAAWQPHAANAQSRFSNDATVLLRALSYSEISMIGVRPQTLVERRDALQRLVNAMVRTEDFITAHSAEALQIAMAHNADKQDLSLSQDWPHRIFQVRLDNLLATALENEAAWLIKRVSSTENAGRAPAFPNYRAAFAPDFLEKVRPQSVTVAKPKG